MWYSQLKTFLLLIFIIKSFKCECHIFPKDSIKNTKDLHLSIIGDPNYFIPRSLYTVHLQSENVFEEFMISVEGNSESGSFQLFNDRLTKFSDDCINTIENSNNFQTKNVQVLWLSPLEGCQQFIAHVKSDANGWEYINKTVCSQKESNEETISTKCCSCDHAKYKLLFHGLWSPERHPKDFPKTLEFTHFSDLIGASHSSNYTMWKEGGLATFGMKQLAEFGVVSDMEVELKRSGKYLKSLIKAAGLWHPNLNGNMTGTFKVDPRHNLISLASMFGPSPDWIVGISSLNLCLEDCTWKEHLEFDLFPYDAGTDNGISYLSIKSASEPQEKISRMTSTYPDDPRSPFHDPTGNEMPSLAKLYITREKVIPKLCTDLTENEILEEVTITDNSEDENRGECQVTEYSSWSSCAVSCGKGIRMKQRTYVNDTQAELSNCKRQLISKEMCIGAQPKCPGEEEDDEPMFLSGECDVTTWSNWTDCSVTCGIGSKVRQRQFKSDDARSQKKCSDIALTDVAKCMLPPCYANEKKNRRECSLNEWSNWSTCSVTCGTGVLIRVRTFRSDQALKSCSSVTLQQMVPCNSSKDCALDPNEAKKACNSEIQKGPCRGIFHRWGYNAETQECKLFEYGGCRGNRNNFETLEECSTTCVDDKVKSKLFNDNKPKNCVVSKWSMWSPCQPCTDGIKSKTRIVIKKPINGGEPCPELIRTTTCSVPPQFCNIISNVP